MDLKLVAAAGLGCSLSFGALADTYSVATGTPIKVDDGIQYEVPYTDFDETKGTLDRFTLTLRGVYTAAIRTTTPHTSPVANFSNSTLRVYGIQVGCYGEHTAVFVGNTASVSFPFTFTAVLPNGLALGSGADQFYLVGSQRVTNSVAISGADIVEISTLSNVTGTATYDFTPSGVAVPEPGSLILLGVGMLGTGVLTRSRRSTA